MRSDRLPDLTRAIPSVVAVLLLAAACSAPPAGSPSQSPTPTPSAAAPSPSATASPTVVPTVAPSPSPSGPPNVGTAPDGPWSRLSWLDAGSVPLGPTSVSVHGWTGGFVALEQTSGYTDSGDEIPVVIRASASTDGVRWSSPTTLDTVGFKGGIDIERVVEGPSGLLALGYPYGDTCGGPPVLVALWSSPDGRAWERLTLPKDFRTGQVQTISGGSSGFIAAGTRSDGTTQALWTSPDGRAWAARPLPKVTSGVFVLDGAISFAGGFEVAGSVLGEEGCGGAAHVHPATWWSADGAAWSRATLPGALTAPNANLFIRRLSDRVILASQTSPDGSTVLAWTSTDGRTWSAVPKPSDQLWLDREGGFGHSALIIEPEAGAGALTVEVIGEDAGVTTLAQTNDVPVASEDGPGWIYAVGPTGILVVGDDGGSAWLGVPS
jgi:hypothetical protein